MVIRRWIVLLGAATAGFLPAQTVNPLSSEVRKSYADVKGFLIKMAEMMPEEHYKFQPTPDVETFGRRIAHITDGNMRNCSGLKGEQKSLAAASKTSKADLVAAIKESFAYCDPIFESLTDAAAIEMVDASTASPPYRGEKRTRLSVLYNLVRHSNEVYGYISVYMRLKGLVPPSSEGR